MLRTCVGGPWVQSWFETISLLALHTNSEGEHIGFLSYVLFYPICNKFAINYITSYSANHAAVLCALHAPYRHLSVLIPLNTTLPGLCNPWQSSIKQKQHIYLCTIHKGPSILPWGTPQSISNGCDTKAPEQNMNKASQALYQRDLPISCFYWLKCHDQLHQM